MATVIATSTHAPTAVPLAWLDTPPHRHSHFFSSELACTCTPYSPGPENGPQERQGDTGQEEGRRRPRTRHPASQEGQGGAPPGQRLGRCALRPERRENQKGHWQRLQPHSRAEGREVHPG
eukprot:8230755-Pyramimonas_sp.AAC.1